MTILLLSSFCFIPQWCWALKSIWCYAFFFLFLELFGDSTLLLLSNNLGSYEFAIVTPYWPCWHINVTTTLPPITLPCFCKRKSNNNDGFRYRKLVNHCRSFLKLYILRTIQISALSKPKQDHGMIMLGEILCWLSAIWHAEPPTPVLPYVLQTLFIYLAQC